MTTRLHTLLLPALLFAPVFAQDDMQMGPAPEVQKLARMIGSWAGTGKMVEPGGVATPWQATGTYRWCLGGHFVREDFRITFEGNPVPMVFRSYMGWDRENSRYVTVISNNGGTVQHHELQLLPDGTLLQLMIQQQGGMTYAERSRSRADGDKMSMQIDLLMPEGASLQMIDAELERTDKAFDGDFEVAGWMGAAPNETMQKLGRMAGIYSVDGKMVMAPGQPASGITGTDTFSTLWGGNVIQGHTDGMAEGMPGKYESDAFWGWDDHRNCVSVVWADNMGQIGQMELRYSGDSAVSTAAAMQQGQPTLQRFVLEFDENGACKTGVGHTIMGTMAPFESFRATYKKKRVASLR